MSTTTSLLALLTQPALRDEVDRVAAAVGVRVIHVDEAARVSRKAWSAATAVLLDEHTAAGCGNGVLPRRTHVVVLTGTAPTATTWQTALSVGAQRVLTMPADADELIHQLTEAGEAAGGGGYGGGHGARAGAVIAVAGGRGGAGASLFATALAVTAGEALLVDLDPWGGGIDLLTGSENAPGLRWPDLAPRGGRLSWQAVRAALPTHPGQPGVGILSGTRSGYELDAHAVEAVVDAGRRGGATVVADLPREMTDATETALHLADLVVLVTPCEVRASAATSATAPRVAAVNPNVGLVVRGPSPGGLRAAEVAAIAGLPLLASMRAEPRLTARLEHGGLRLPRRSALATAARRVLEVLPSGGHPLAVKAAA